jgi:glycosyltransferase involved in cell wall biosynthesis
VTSVPRRVSIFVPAYNEAEHLADAVAEIAEAAESTLDDYEILVVNDGSTDGTGPLADRLARERSKVRVIHHAQNQGIAAGYVDALEAARFEYFAFLPADREINPGSVKNILAATGSADVVVPYHANPSARQRHRRVLTWTSTALVNTLFGLRPVLPGPMRLSDVARQGGAEDRGRLLLPDADARARALRRPQLRARRPDPPGAAPRPVQGPVGPERAAGTPDDRRAVVGDSRPRRLAAPEVLA